MPRRYKIAEDGHPRANTIRVVAEGDASMTPCLSKADAQRLGFGNFPPPPTPPPATAWDKTRSNNIYFTFTNDDQTISLPGGDSTIRANYGKSTGKFVYEFILTAVPTNVNIRQWVGITPSNFLPEGGRAGQGLGEVYIGAATSQIWNNNSQISANASAQTGDVISVKVDIDTGMVEFFRNGNSLHVPIAIDGFTPGVHTLYPCVAFQTGFTPNITTANFSANLIYPAVATAGYTAGWLPSPPTWDATLSAFILTQGDMLADSQGASIMRATAFKSDGKYVFEQKLTTPVANARPGLIKLGQSLSGAPGDSGSGVGYQGSTIYKGSGGTMAASANLSTNNSVVSTFVNLNTGKVRFYLNGVAVCAEFSLPGWIAGSQWFPAFAGTGGEAISRANFGATVLDYPAVASDNGAVAGWF